MKTMITLAAASILMFSACKKGEIEDVKPMTVNQNSDLKSEAKLAASQNENTEVHDDNSVPTDNPNGRY
jgi:hypothetical protein